jgi:hypothetical protein
MKESYDVEIVNTKGILNSNQQAFFRNRLKQLLEKEEIISICIDERSLFIEYNPNTLSKTSLKDLLIEYSSPMGELLLESTNEFHIG